MENLEAMRAALRVLTALNEKREAAATDIEELRSYTGAEPPGMAPDELACTVIQKALERRSRSSDHLPEEPKPPAPRRDSASSASIHSTGS
jgi:hypothetical protein